MVLGKTADFSIGQEIWFILGKGSDKLYLYMEYQICLGKRGSHARSLAASQAQHGGHRTWIDVLAAANST